MREEKRTLLHGKVDFFSRIFVYLNKSEATERNEELRKKPFALRKSDLSVVSLHTDGHRNKRQFAVQITLDTSLLQETEFIAPSFCTCLYDSNKMYLCTAHMTSPNLIARI